MDLSALLGPASVPSAPPTGATGAASAVAGDAFAALFASALQVKPGAEATPIASAGIADPSVAIPKVAVSMSAVVDLNPSPALASIAPTSAAVTPMAETAALLDDVPIQTGANVAVPSEHDPAVQTQPTATYRPAVMPNILPATAAQGSTEVLPSAPTLNPLAPEPATETVQPRDSGETPAPHPTNVRVRTKTASPPESSPPPPAVSVAKEKEAPTTAPNAPVTPLDRTSEDDETPTAPTPEAQRALTAASLAVASVGVLASPTLVPSVSTVVAPKVPVDAPASSLSVPVGKAPSKSAAGATTTKAGVDAAPTMGETVVPSEETEARTTPTEPQSAAAEMSPRVATDTSETSVEVGVSDPLPAPAVPAPSLAKLPVAPDLGVAAPVVQAAVAAPTVVPIATAPNVQVARVAARSVAVVGEKPADPASKVAATKADAALPDFAVAPREAATDGDAAPQDDAPTDNPNPTPEAPVVKTAATEQPEAGTARPSVDRHLVVRQVADRIESLVAARPKDGVTIHLEPRDLGTVTLVVKGMQKALDVQVFASDDRVRQSLDKSRTDLAQALAPRGIEVREMRVSTAPAAAPASPNSSAAADPNAQKDAQDRPRSPNPSPTYAKASRTAEPTAPTPRAARSGRGVDLLV